MNNKTVKKIRKETRKEIQKNHGEIAAEYQEQVNSIKKHAAFLFRKKRSYYIYCFFFYFYTILFLSIALYFYIKMGVFL